MASIFLAKDEVTDRSVAVKVLYDYYADNEVIRTRFLEEGRLQQMLRHPNIVHVLNVVEEPVLAFVMEHVDGPTLDDYLIHNGPLSEQELVDIIIPVMSAVGFAHSKGVVHRDIKPSNILVENRGGIMVPKVMDFGVAKVQSAKRDLTATGTTVGTLHYMSPEQIVGSKKIDGRADIYSIGVTIYKLMTGEVPFNAPTEFALMMAQVEAPPLPPRQLREDLSKELESVILRAMAKKADERFPSIKAFTQALLRAKSSAGKGIVADTLTDRIPAQILQFAMEADEIATDRTGEMDLSSANRLIAQSGSSLNLDEAPTHELNRKRVRNKIEFPEVDNEATEEISAFALERMTAEAEAYNAAKATEEETLDVNETVPIASLDERLSKADTSDENLRQTVESPEPVDDAATLDDKKSDNVTRPSRPSAMLGRKPDTGDRKVRRSGVEVFDSQANSRDRTAPKMSEKDYNRALENVRNSSEFVPDNSRSSGGRSPLGGPNGPRERVPAKLPDDDPPKTDGPKVVLGKDYADTSERTKQNMSKADLNAGWRAQNKGQARESSRLDRPGGVDSKLPPPPPHKSPFDGEHEGDSPSPPSPFDRDLSSLADVRQPSDARDLKTTNQPSAPRRNGTDTKMIILLVVSIMVIIAASLWIGYYLFMM